MEIEIKYFDNAKKLEINPKGDLIDLYAREDVFVPYMGYAMIPLGIATKLPEGKMAKVYPRSSTFKTWGVIQTNHCGIIDSSYCGNDDEWQYPVQCTMPKHELKTVIEGAKVTILGTWIKAGDKICQFEIVDKPSKYDFEEVEFLNYENRDGFGTTGTK